jgi:hypothetical protein
MTTKEDSENLRFFENVELFELQRISVGVRLSRVRTEVTAATAPCTGSSRAVGICTPSECATTWTHPVFLCSTMASNSSSSRTQSVGAPEEPKARGANRSTKVAGKLKVLPEQPEPELVPAKRTLLAPLRDKGESSTTDEEEGDDDETEDVEVRRVASDSFFESLKPACL